MSSKIAKVSQVVMGKKKPTYSIAFDGANTYINASSDAGIDDLMSGIFTFETFINYTAVAAASCAIADKGYFTTNRGWVLYISGGDVLAAAGRYATSNASTTSLAPTLRGNGWHHVVMCISDVDKKAWLATDGVWSGVPVAGVGNAVADAAGNLNLGRRNDGGGWLFTGSLGWSRLSNIDRYGVGVNFTAPSRLAPPAPDANTLQLYKLMEGTGTALDNAEGTAGRDGTLVTGTWVKN